MSTASYPHILIDDFGTARIGQTRYKVIHLLSQKPVVCCRHCDTMH
jgi:hypothetical protein